MLQEKTIGGHLHNQKAASRDGWGMAYSRHEKSCVKKLLTRWRDLQNNADLSKLERRKS